VAEAVRAFAPGRVNLIGEHTDYNGGLSLPFAIDAGVTVTASPADGNQITVHANDLDEQDTFSLGNAARCDGWRAYARGAVAELTRAGCELRGARLEISGSVPRGSGLSSSAALAVALCLGLLAVAEAQAPQRLELARICSEIENRWVGAQTGLLDQIASLFGEAGHALLIDFRTLAVEPVPLSLGDYSLVILDSGQSHVNASGDDSPDGEAGYNQRRQECARACELLGVSCLSDAEPAMADDLPRPLADRVRHVLGENVRVRETVAALHDGDPLRVGELLDESHASLRDLYDISTPAVEEAVACLKDSGAVGARIVGGGFGGHVLGLMAPGSQLLEEAVVVTPGPGATVTE
jgi:galactokinase